MLRRLFGGEKRSERDEADERMPQLRAQQVEEANLQTEKPLKTIEDLTTFAEVATAISAREVVFGPDAKPWRERRTEKPAGYRSTTWDYWKFEDDDGLDAVGIAEECVGTIFPDDWIIVNDEYRRVLSISKEYEWPVALLTQDRRPLNK